MKTSLTFCDLVHREHSAQVIPLGILMVASYAVKKFHSCLEVEIFKSADEFLRHVDKKIPRIACFSNYTWNSNLSYQVASRIKKKYPKTIIVVGGPNYPLDVQEQEEFLKAHPDIDFYIEKEGEEAFVRLLDVLFGHDFDIEKIKKKRIKVGNCHYLSGTEFIKGELLPLISDLDDIPSPYLSGLCDKLLSQNLVPLIQFVRGCPFACTFCQDGDEYYNRVRRFSFNRVKEELSYLAKKSEAQTLQCSDLNFGMYEEDLEICREIASVQRKHGWPKHFEGVVGKNKKERIIEATSIIRRTFFSAAVQSTDEQVLKNVKRSNISIEKMFDIVQEAKKSQTTGFSELILGLPGDTKEGHIRSNAELMDAEIDIIRSHQFIMLPAAEASSREQRKKYGLITRFRVVPKTVASYRLFGEKFFAPEIDEICVASNTLSFEDYLECRLFNLTVEIFYNGGIFADLLRLLKRQGVVISSFIVGIHQRIRSSECLSELYDNFLRETKETWESREKLIDLLKSKEVIGKFVSMEMGNNEQLIYRATAILDMMKELHEVAFSFAKDILDSKMKLKEKEIDFLKEFEAFSLLIKGDIFSTGKARRKIFHYDFLRLFKSGFKKDLLEIYVPEGIAFEFSYTDKQKDLIDDNFRIYGKSKNSVAYILATALQNNRPFREVRYATFSEQLSTKN